MTPQEQKKIEQEVFDEPCDYCGHYCGCDSPAMCRDGFCDEEEGEESD